MPQAPQRVRPGRRFQKIEAAVLIVARFLGRCDQLLHRRFLEEISQFGVGVEQLLDLPAQFGVAGTSRFQERARWAAVVLSRAAKNRAST